MQLCGEDKLTRHKSQHRHEAHRSFTLVCGWLSIYTKFRKSLLKTVSQDRKANGFPHFPCPSLLGHQLKVEKLEIPQTAENSENFGNGLLSQLKWRMRRWLCSPSPHSGPLTSGAIYSKTKETAPQTKSVRRNWHQHFRRARSWEENIPHLGIKVESQVSSKGDEVQQRDDGWIWLLLLAFFDIFLFPKGTKMPPLLTLLPPLLSNVCRTKDERCKHFPSSLAHCRLQSFHTDKSK